MTLKEAYEKRRLEVLDLTRENKKLKTLLDKVDNDTYTAEEKVTHIKQIGSLTRALTKAEKDSERFQRLWREAIKHRWSEEFKATTTQLQKDDLEIENKELHIQIESLTQKNSDYINLINKLEEKILQLQTLLNTDGTNSGTPTSQTPLNKKKVIPNSRMKSDKKRGGQPGHIKHTLEPIPEELVTESVPHELDNCPKCGGKLEEISEKIKYETDYEIKIIRRRHIFKEYICLDCGSIVHAPIPAALKEAHQYGTNLQATALSFMNIGFISLNRTRALLNGLLNNQISISEGYLCKLQGRYSNALSDFIDDVKRKCIESPVVYWDDTVAYINTSRSCMRFYGNEKLALYTAHEHKNRAGIDEDDILINLNDSTYVMHDHNTVNYNGDFHFRNLECNQHLQRDLQKLYDISSHQWPAQLKSLISSSIHERNVCIKANEINFPDSFIKEFNNKFKAIMTTAKSESVSDNNRYYHNSEECLIRRLEKYSTNYFEWVNNLSLPTTNNLSERSLRFVKTKCKVSGQFLSIDNAKYFANIRTYMETCHRGNIDPVKALMRLTKGNPVTIQELFCNV